MALMHHLYQLQQLDRQIREIDARLQQLRHALSHAPELEAARLRLEQARQEERQRQKAFEQAEHRVEELKERLEDIIVQLTSGQVRNPRQVHVLYQERLYLERKLEQAEENAIEALLAWEQAQQAVQQAEERLRRTCKERKSKETAWKSEVRRLEMRRQDLMNRRETLVALIPPESLEVYQRLMDQKAGLAVALVQEGTCEACGAMLSAVRQQEAANPNTLTFCSQCGRLLYAP